MALQARNGVDMPRTHHLVLLRHLLLQATTGTAAVLLSCKTLKCSHSHSIRSTTETEWPRSSKDLQEHQAHHGMSLQDSIRIRSPNARHRLRTVDSRHRRRVLSLVRHLSIKARYITLSNSHRNMRPRNKDH